MGALLFARHGALLLLLLRGRGARCLCSSPSSPLPPGDAAEHHPPPPPPPSDGSHGSSSPAEEPFPYSFLQPPRGFPESPADPAERREAIPIVSYPVAAPPPPPPTPPKDSKPSSSTDDRAGFQSGIIAPVFESVQRRRVAPLPEDWRYDEERRPPSAEEPGTFLDGQQGVAHGNAQKWTYTGDAQPGESGARAPWPRYQPRWEAVDDQSQMEQRPRSLLFTPEHEIEIPLPKLVKVETQKSPDPIPLIDAIKKVKANARAQFIETVEAHVRLGIDPKRSDQLVRGAATLPHGIGKVARVAVFAEGDDAESAAAAGAEVVGSEDLIDTIMRSGGKLNFDKCIATPTMMPKLSKVARILGPRGLMPNPKVGTVTKDVFNAVKAAKQGRVDFRADKTGIVHAGIGKVNFSEEDLRDNVAAFATALLGAKPVGLKKTSKYAGYMKAFSICSTMGPGVRVSIQSISQVADNYSKSLELQ